MPAASEILEFKISNFNIVAAVLGGFLTLFGLVSYLLKEKFYLGEACALLGSCLCLIFSWLTTRSNIDHCRTCFWAKRC